MMMHEKSQNAPELIPKEKRKARRWISNHNGESLYIYISTVYIGLSCQLVIDDARVLYLCV